MEKWQLEGINFEIKAIETFLGIKFEGESLEQKIAFIAEHKEKRLEVTGDLLRKAYVDYLKENENFADSKHRKGLILL